VSIKILQQASETVVELPCLKVSIPLYEITGHVHLKVDVSVLPIGVARGECPQNF